MGCWAAQAAVLLPGWPALLQKSHTHLKSSRSGAVSPSARGRTDIASCCGASTSVPATRKR
jgi:hypothetical protein